MRRSARQCTLTCNVGTRMRTTHGSHMKKAGGECPHQPAKELNPTLPGVLRLPSGVCPWTASPWELAHRINCLHCAVRSLATPRSDAGCLSAPLQSGLQAGYLLAPSRLLVPPVSLPSLRGETRALHARFQTSVETIGFNIEDRGARTLPARCAASSAFRAYESWFESRPAPLAPSRSPVDAAIRPDVSVAEREATLLHEREDRRTLGVGPAVEVRDAATS